MFEEKTSVHANNIKRQTHAHEEQKDSSFFRPAIQPRLGINQPGDGFEQEAEATATRIMRTSGNLNCLQHAKHISGKKSGDMTGHGMDAPPIVHDVIHSPGKSLDSGTTHIMESKFGYDFSKVQIHNDPLAHQSSEQINALAYTHNNHIVFGPGQYQPATLSGQQLLAHELTHVIQQNTNVGNSTHSVMRAEKPDDQFESCNTPQKALLQPAIDDARNSVHAASAVVGSALGRPDKISPAHKQLFLDHFHTTAPADLRNILGKYVSLGKSLDAGASVKCESPCPKINGHTVQGYALNTRWLGGIGPLHICFDPKGWDFSAATPKDRQILIIHEGSHRYAGVDDKAYVDEPAKYQALSSSDAMDNADSYAIFATLL